MKAARLHLGLNFVCGLLAANAMAGSDIHKDQVVVFSRAETFTFSENLPVDTWLDDLHAPDPSFSPSAGEYAMTRNAAELGVGWRKFSLSGFARRDYYFYFSNDTFDLVYKDKNDIPIPQDRNYDIFLDVAHINIRGAKIAYEFSPIPAVTTKLTWGLFTAEDLLFGKIEGYLGSRNGKIQGDLNLDYNYTEDVVLDRELTPPGEGQGRSLSIAAQWQVRDNLLLNVNLEDLYGVIKWRRAPFTEATITTVRTYTDRDGNRRRMPTISGTEYFRNIRQSLPKHTDVNLEYRVNSRVSVAAQYDRYGDLAFKRLNGSYHLNSSTRIGCGYDFDAEAPRLSIESRYISLMLSADSSDARALKSLNASLALQAVF